MSECKSKNPNFCRYHGDSRKIGFEKRVKHQLEFARKRLAEAEATNIDDFMEAKNLLEEAEIEYAATTLGEEELRKKIADSKWPDNEVLEQKLEEALKLRSRLEEEDSDEGTYCFPSSKLDEAVKRIEKANRKLERAGVEERFTYTTEEYIEEDKDGNKYFMTKLEVSHPSIKASGWDFVAAVDKTPDGDTIIRALPNQEIGDARPEGGLVCEHCGRARHRKTTYLLRNNEGEYKQVGSACLSSFLGVEPKGLWTLNYDFDSELSLNSVPQYGGTDTVLNLQEVVAYGLAVSDNGNSFVSASSAQEYDTISTSSMVKQQLFSSKNKDKVVLSEEDFIRAKKLIEETNIEGDTEYARNMRSILKSENLNIRHVGMAVSVIAAANRERWKKEREEAQKNQVKSVGYLGNIGDKVSNIELAIKRVDYYDGNYGTQTRIIMTADDGKEVVWTATGYRSAEVGDTIKIKSATIKNHKQFNDNDQTILTRARIDENQDT